MKKLIVLGDSCYFPDSFVWFKEHEFELYYVEIKDGCPRFKIEEDLMVNIGAANIPRDKIDQLYEKLDKETLVLCCPNFFGDIKSLKGRHGDQNPTERLEVVYNLSKYNKDHGCGAKFVLVFNGDTGFGSQKMVDFFNEKIQYVDCLMFDNDLLKEFVLQNSSVARTKKTMIAWLETPLKRYVIHQTQKPKHEMIALGRCISAFNEMMANKMGLPITFFPKENPRCTLKNLLKKCFDKIRGKPYVYFLSGISRRLEKVFKHRRKFQKYESARAFGLSHMYDVFFGGVEKFRDNKEYYFSLEGQQIPNSADTQKELYYPFVNNPNKEACYMMYGIIPLISHAEHSYYKILLEKKMAILIKNREDFRKALSMSDEEIQEYRDNIYANQDVYTFDHVGEMLLAEVTPENTIN